MAAPRRGPFDRLLSNAGPGSDGPEQPDRAAIYVGGTIIGLAILSIILLLPPISILSRGADTAEGIPSGPGDAERPTAVKRSGVPKLPAGLVAASPLFDLAAPENQRGPSRLIVGGLTDGATEARNLALYSYVDGSWQRLSDVTIVASGQAARGEVSALPGNVIVLRRDRATLQVAGSLPGGATVNERAAGVINTLHPIVFVPAPDGSLDGQPPAVPPAGYEVVPAVVPFTPEVVNDILRSTELQSAHVEAIAERVRLGNYAGINIDYRTISPALRDQYTAFVRLLAESLHDDGRSLTLTLPLPASDGGSIDTGAYDWEALGGQADTIELAGELDQELCTFRTPSERCDYIVERVDRSKILLPISSLSVERGGDGLTAMSFDSAMLLASAVAKKSPGDITPGATVQLVAQNVSAAEGASGLHWDDAARAVTFSYPGRGGKRTVWIANAFSAAFRLELAQRYELGGVVIDDVSEQGGGADVWSPVQQLSDTGELSLSRPNGELFAPAWSSAEGTVSPGVGDAVTWTAPGEAGTFTVTLIVSDGVTRAGQQVSLDVIEPAAPPE